MNLQKRIEGIIEHVATDMHERQEIIAIALLGALSNQNTFLLGPPGTAKSLISRRIASAFKEPSYFECLMNRFSTPEELFGPVSIKELKEDRYTRKIENYLPTAEFAFLDEIWKSSPAILNALLTLINEGVYKNGHELIYTPLKALISASNETPELNQGLDALYDRFIVRLMVSPIAEKGNFELLLNSKPTKSQVNVPEGLIINQDEWESWSKDINSVELSQETIATIHLIRRELEEQFGTLGVYVSDRRWQKAARLVKASAFFNNRKETNHSDSLLLSHCIWTTEENREGVIKIVHDSVSEVGFTSDISIAELDREKGSLDKEIRKELLHKEDVYKNVVLIGKEQCFKATISFNDRYNSSNNQKTLYIPFGKMNSKDKFKALDSKGNELPEYECTFDGQGTCLLEKRDRHYSEKGTFTPKILFHKNDKKSDVNDRLITALKESVIEVRRKLLDVLEVCKLKNSSYRTDLKSVFIDENLLNIPLSGIDKQIESIEMRIKDCQRLEAMCSD